MLKQLSLSILTITSLSAQEANPEELNAIYLEAVLFIAVFGVMGIVSYIYSSRHAAQYTKDQAKKVALNKTRVADQAEKREERLSELSKLLKDGVIKEDEFKILRANI